MLYLQELLAGQEIIIHLIINPLGLMHPHFIILLSLTPDNFTRQGESETCVNTRMG